MDEMFIKKDESMLVIIPLALIVIFSLKGFGTLLQKLFYGLFGEDIIRKIRDNLGGSILDGIQDNGNFTKYKKMEEVN